MTWLAYILIGILSGVLGGMGMGGGTVLIPFLGIFCGTEQHAAQAINLVAFVPMAVIALIIHFKNGLIKTRGLWKIVLSGAVACVVGVFLAKSIRGDLLKRIFGGFLIILSIIGAWGTAVAGKDKDA